MSIWIVSDFHFGHEKDFLWQPRGFSNWKEHGEALISNYNSVVKDSDIIYVLGDCMLKNDDYGIECLKRLKGHKYLSFGNHDSEARIDHYVSEHIFEDIQYGYRIRDGKYTFFLQHYPAMMGNYKDKKPVFCLAGHTHSPDKFQNMEEGCYNIAVDAHKCFPVSLDQVLKDIKEYRETHPVNEYLNKTPYCNFCLIKYACEALNNHNLSCPGYIPLEEYNNDIN